MLTHSVKSYSELEDSKTSAHRYEAKMESQQTKAGPSKGTESDNGNRTPSPIISPASSEIVLQEIDNSIPAPEQAGEPENAEKTDNTANEPAEKVTDNLPKARVVRGCCRNCRNKRGKQEAELPVDKDGVESKDNEPCCRGLKKGMMKRSLRFYGKAKHCHKGMGEAQRPCCKSTKEKCGNDFASEEMTGRCKKRGGFKRCFGRRFGNHSDHEELVGETHHDSSSDNEDSPHDGRQGKKHGFRKCFKKGHDGHSDPEGFVSEQDNEARKCHRKKRDIASDTEGNFADGRQGEMCKKRFQTKHGRYFETKRCFCEQDNASDIEGNTAGGRHEKGNKCKKHFQMRHGGHSETEGFTSEQDNQARECHRKRHGIASDTEGNTTGGRHEKGNKCKKHFQMRHGGHSETEECTSEPDNHARKCCRKKCSSADESRENRNTFKKHFHMRQRCHSETEESEQEDNVRNCCHKRRQTVETENAGSGRPDFRQLFWSLMNNQNMHHGGGRFEKMGKHHFGHHMKHGGHFGKMGKHFGHHMKHGGRFGKMGKHQFEKHGGGHFGKMGKHFGHHMKHGHHHGSKFHHHGRHGFLNKHGRFGHEQSGHYQRKNESFDGTLADAMVIVLE